MTYAPFVTGAVMVLVCLVSLHIAQVLLDRRDRRREAAERQARRAAGRRELETTLRSVTTQAGRSPAAPGTMRRRYSDLTEPGDSGDEGASAWPRSDW